MSKKLPLPEAVHREAVRAILFVSNGNPSLIPDAVTDLIEGASQISPVVHRVSESLPAFSDWLIDENEQIDANFADPSADFTLEDWDALYDQIAWYALYADALHGAAITADILRAQDGDDTSSRKS
jgi:hypothetical protein